MPDPPHILVVDDEPQITRVLRTSLSSQGYDIRVANSGEMALEIMKDWSPNLIITDLSMPSVDGVQLCRAVRAVSQVPIIVLSVRDKEQQKVEALDAGADDYVTKPFHMEEVLARLRALTRRAAGHATAEIACGPVRLDTKSGRVHVDGAPVKLTSHEYRLLSYLMHHSGRVVSRSELVEHLYDQDFDRDSNTIEVFVGRIRRKLGVDVIQTVRGLGYMLSAPGDAA